jgi:starvation-inducible DNA-binding protein
MSGDNATKALIDSLNGLLADYFALYLKTKNYHWHVAGPQFRDLHLLFDEQAAEIFALTDIVGERVRKNGATRSPRSARWPPRPASRTTTAPGRCDGHGQGPARRQCRAGGHHPQGEGRRHRSRRQRHRRHADDWTDQAQQRVWFLTQILA